MKKQLILLVLSCIILSGCAGWQVNGVETAKFKNMTIEDFVVTASGVAASGCVHTLGHLVYLETADIDYHLDGTNEVIDQRLSNGQWSAAGRAGFVGQLGFGILLNAVFPDARFTTGYDIGSFAEIAAYPLYEQDGDLDAIEKSGQQREEWAAYTAISAGLLAW